MNSPIQFYEKELEKLEKQLKQFEKKLLNSSLIRLLVFCLVVFGLYYFFSNATVLIPFLVVSIALFIFLVSRHADLDLRKKKLQALIKINRLEIDVMNGDLSNLETGSEFKDHAHEFSYDIDLFGKGSFFEYLNRTAVNSGTKMLVDLLESNNTQNIPLKQQAIQELSEKPKWRQNYSAIASLVKVDIETKQILNWMKNHKTFVPKSMRYLPQLFSLVSLLLIILNYFSIVPVSVTIVWFFVGLGIVGVFLKRINMFYYNSNKAKDTFKQYHQLLSLIESETFDSDVLKSKQEDIKSESKNASEVFREFSKLLDAFDQRNNMLIGVFANGLALRDLQLCYKIEIWISKYQSQVERWFEAIAFFDAQNSLANFHFNHPKFNFPEITAITAVLEAKSLGHPLISEEKRVDNDFNISKEEFYIITGANMAGKSTFLRTVSLAIVMANLGLPICAINPKYNPVKLITSMRTSDSLTDDESYFFSELKRLKYIIDHISTPQADSDYFIVLDEILKGTNSKDKAIGSRKFVERLVQSKATGLIATHDLSLCEISETLVEVSNYYFDAEIINDELHFDYRFKDGVCKNMNASFLLKKMDIV